MTDPPGSGGAGPPSVAELGQLDEAERRRLSPPSTLHAEVDRIADQLGVSVGGDLDFTVHVDADDFTLQKLAVMINFLLDTTRRALAAVEERSRRLEEQLDTLQAQRSLIHELSTPILRIWAGILVLPLIGALTPDRSALLMDRLLGSVAREQAGVVLIDVTGVPEIDARAAADLARMVRAAALLGARCVLTGVQPAVAQAIVAEGLDLGAMGAQRDLHEALRACLREARAGRDRAR